MTKIGMPRWLKVIRGMIGMGLTFSVGVGVAASMIAGLMWLIPGGFSGQELIGAVIKGSIIAFPIGVAFSGVLAITACGHPFEKLSLPQVAALGAGGGFLLFGLMAVNAWQAWSVSTAIVNGVLFTLLGSGSAAASLMLARRAGRALESGDESRRLETPEPAGPESPPPG